MTFGPFGTQILVCIGLALAFACSKAKPNDDAAVLACQSACKRLVSARGQAGDDGSHTECILACVRDLGRSRSADCESQHVAYLTCVDRHGESTRAGGASAAFTLEHALGISSCEKEHLRYEKCTAPCREAGVVRTGVRAVVESGRTLRVQAELVATGCGPNEPVAAKHSPPGSACEHHSVCSATRCACEGRAYGYLARACVENRCAEAGPACRLVPEAVGYTACAARP